MADISKIKTLDGTTYNIKDATARSSIPAAASANPLMDGVVAVGSSTKYAKEDHVHPSDTTKWTINNYGVGTTDISIRPLVASARANRLAFLPADQIIIEQTTDGGTTWTDAGCSDVQKKALFATRNGNISIPRLNGAKSTNCGLRITITGMKYDVPSGTAETSKYTYWNKDHVIKNERYTNLREMWFWLSSNNDAIRVQVYRATGANSNNWIQEFNTDFELTGWSGSDWIRLGNPTFGGGVTQTGNYWNWRIIFWSKMHAGDTAFRSQTVQTISGISGYGDNVWGFSNQLMYEDHIYSWDADQNVTFPEKVTADSFNGNLTGTATTATNVSGASASANADRHVWFSDSSTETKRAYDDDFKYNPSTNTLTTNISGKINNHTVNSDVPADAKFTDTTYESKTAASGGTALSLVTTGEKYTWNQKGSGTITGIKMNGASKGTSGVVDLGTVITAHQDISGKLNSSLKGAANGLAELDANGKVPSSQLPSYVDDVLEYAKQASFPSTGETGKIYIDLATNKTYRWSGSSYVEISQSLALGTTSSTAYRGDYGNAAYTHAVTNKGSAFTSGLYKITTNSEGHVTGATAVTKTDITALGIPGSDTNTKYTANTSKLVTTTVPNVTSAGSAPTLGTAIPADDITEWTTNVPTNFEVIGEKLKITVGSAATLKYTAKSIPNVTSAGSAPTFGTAITVATGALASSGSGGTVATGITAS